MQNFGRKYLIVVMQNFGKESLNIDTSLQPFYFCKKHYLFFLNHYFFYWILYAIVSFFFFTNFVWGIFLSFIHILILSLMFFLIGQLDRCHLLQLILELILTQWVIIGRVQMARDFCRTFSQLKIHQFL